MTLQDALTSYKAAKSRLFLLDYDGTLSDLAPTPEQAVPTKELLETLEKLSNQPHTTVVIVSGRDKETLTEWLSHLPLAFAAEHGFWRKLVGQDWQATLEDDASWKHAIRQLMQEATIANPGSLIEEKASGLVWHYRTADQADTAEATAKALANEIGTLQHTLGLRILAGNKNVEVQLSGTDKGKAAAHWLQDNYDFVLAAGDDATDEDLFNAMPESAVTIKVGEGATAARLRLADAAAMRDFLHQFL